MAGATLPHVRRHEYIGFCCPYRQLAMYSTVLQVLEVILNIPSKLNGTMDCASSLALLLIVKGKTALFPIHFPAYRWSCYILQIDRQHLSLIGTHDSVVEF